MSDLVERLRHFAVGAAPDSLLCEAADEIERLHKLQSDYVDAIQEATSEATRKALEWAADRVRVHLGSETVAALIRRGPGGAK